MRARNIRPSLRLGLELVAVIGLGACGGGSEPTTGVASTNSATTSDGRVTAQAVHNTALPQYRGAATRPAPKSAAPTTGRGYYVDSATGSLSNPGTQDLPWLTLAQVKAIKLAPGDIVYLHCGSIWREAVNMDTHTLVDGASFTTYGSCANNAKAIISGADADQFIGGWTRSGNIWSKQLPASTPAIKVLYINGTPMRLAQWPNYGGLGHEYALTSAAMPLSSLTLAVANADVAALQGKDLVGAAVQVRSEPWIVEQRTVSSTSNVSGNLTLTFDKPTGYAMDPSEGYLLQNKLWMLDVPGEFFHDTSTGKVYVYPSTALAQFNLNAPSIQIEGSVRDTNFALVYASGLHISNISFVKARFDGLVLSNTPDAVVDNITADDNGNDGVYLASSGTDIPSPAGTVIKNSAFQRNVMNGVDASYISSVQLLNNIVSDTGMSSNAGNSNAGLGVGPGGVVQGNTVSNSAQVGIYFSGSKVGTTPTTVNGNVVVDSSQRLSDGGAIKTRNGTNLSSGTQLSRVDSNVIVRAPGNSEGSVGGSKDWGGGVYLDDFTLNCTISNNFIVGAGVGIVVHNSSYNIIQSNRVALVAQEAVFASMDQSSADYLVGNAFTQNQWMTFSKFSGTFPNLPGASNPPAVRFTHLLLGASAISATDNSFSGNKFQLPTGTSTSVAIVGGSSGTSFLSIQDWLAIAPNDSLATTVPHYSTSSLQTTGSELIVGGGFDSGLGSWTWYADPNAVPAGTVSAQALQGCAGLCAVVQSGSINDNLASPPLNLTGGGLYYLSYTASFDDAGTIGRPYVRTAGPPYLNFAPDSNRVSASSLTGLQGVTSQQETFFVAAPVAAGGVVALSASAGTRVGFDQVSLRQLSNYSFPAASDWVSYAYGGTAGPSLVTCVSLGWPSACRVTDVNGRAVTLPTQLPAGKGVVYFRADSSWRKQ